MSYRTSPKHPPQTVCKIDGAVFDTERQLLFYLKKLKISYKDYYDNFLKVDEEDICKVCNAHTKYNNLQYGYARFCSHTCSVNDVDIAVSRKNKTKEALIQKYGVSNPSQIPGWRDKVKSTNVNKYGVENYVNPVKAKQTQLEKYGMHYVNTPEYKKSVRNTSQEKYGVEHFTQSSTVKKKQYATTLARHGVEKYLSLVGKQKTAVTHKMKKLYTYIQQYASIHNLSVDLPDEDTFISDSKNRIFNTTCIICNNSFLANWRSTTIPVTCKHCIKPSWISKWEREVSDYIKSLTTYNIINNHREYEGSTLHELDIYIPELKLAFECNGVYWHGELNGGKTKHYHVNKTNYYENNSIQIIQIWDVEWNAKREIVKSKIQNLLGLTPTKIFARKLTPVVISSKEARKFFNETHLGGFLPAKYHIGLVDAHGNIMSAMSVSNKGRLGISAHSAELLRFSSKLGHVVVGGFSKLIKYLLNTVAPELNTRSIVSYADKRWSCSAKCGYVHAGFKLARTAQPSYWYVKSGKIYHRTLFMKHLLSKKLTTFDCELTEFENMTLNKYDRIWDCGELVYVYESK
jgi:hypothetical protein